MALLPSTSHWDISTGTACNPMNGYWQTYTGSLWGIQVWYDRLLSVTAAFFLLQNRARAAGMKSEVWVLAVIVTGSMGLLLMLARTVYLERKHAR